MYLQYYLEQLDYSNLPNFLIKYLIECLKEDDIDINEIINFKKYSVVDNDRPKVCADRIDGVILTGIGWTKNIANIVKDMCIFLNENNEDEIGFKSSEVAKKVLEVSESIDIYCHSREDNYMMQLLAKITKLSIEKNILLMKNYMLIMKDIYFQC